MRFKFIITVVLLQFGTVLSYGQNQIQGVIYSKDSGNPLSNANIVFNEEKGGTISNRDGIYVLSSVNIEDTVTISYLGFNTVTIAVSDLVKSPDIYMDESVTVLDDIFVSNKELSAKEIMKKVDSNFKRNHSVPNRGFKIYYHPEGVVKLNSRGAKLVKSSIDRINQNFLDSIMDDIPETMITYTDLISDIYICEGESKGKIIDGVVLSDQAKMDAISQLSYIEDLITVSLKKEDHFWKFKSGLLGGKMDKGDISSSDEEKVPDSLARRYTHYLRSSIANGLNLMDDDDSVWEFISKPGKYSYSLKGITKFNSEYVYHIIFEPSGGKYMGELYISEDSYALLKVNYSYAPNKDGVDISMFGVDVCEDVKEESVIFQKYGDNYLPKYRRILDGMSVKIDRPAEMIEKRKRFLFNKELRSAKVNITLDITSKESREILILSDSELDEAKFKDMEEAKYSYMKKITEYNREILNNYSIILPKSEVLRYRKPEEL